MTIREEAHRLLDRLSDSDLATVARMLRGLTLPPPEAEAKPPAGESDEERRARIYALAGSAAHLPGSVDEFLARKRADKIREDEADRRRQAGEG